MRKFLKFLIITLFLFLPGIVKASDYEIKSYDITIKVNENNILDITEEISAFFNTAKHGIFRKIPLKNTVTRLDGTTETNDATIRDITVNEQYTVYLEGKYKVIKIGDPNMMITGDENYHISYKYNLGKDKSNKYDELYFNLIGSEWDTTISNITFKIIMPKTFDLSRLGFSSGAPGSTDSSNITYTVNDNIITGSYQAALHSGHGLTVRLELPEGYFHDFVFDMEIEPKVLILFIACLVSLALASIMWRNANKNTKIEIVEFYPPENMNSMDLAFIYKGKVKNNDVISLLIHLANKGYLSIFEVATTGWFMKRKDFKITKLKPYTGVNVDERTFFNGLFYNRDEITKINLQNNFYRTINEIKSGVNSLENQKIMFESKSLKNELIIWISIILIVFLMFIDLSSGFDIATIIFESIFYVLPIVSLLYVFDSDGQHKDKLVFLLFLAIWGAYMGLLSLIISVFVGNYWGVYLFSIAVIIILFILKKNVKKRTSYGENLYIRIKGFNRFLKTVEKDKLEALVMQEPNYFYDILPYTYVLGISDKWIKKFETISLQAPTWYNNSSNFNLNTFGSFMNSTMSSAKTAMSSSPGSSGSSSGGSSGGGSSGGGSGGGGGGSW